MSSLRRKPKYVDPLLGIHKAVTTGMRLSMKKHGQLVEYDSWRRRKALRLQNGSAR